MPSGTNRGVVAMVNTRGYGFIKPDAGGPDIFFHASGMAEDEVFDELTKDDLVSYEIEQTTERPRAVAVCKL